MVSTIVEVVLRKGSTGGAVNTGQVMRTLLLLRRCDS